MIIGFVDLNGKKFKVFNGAYLKVSINTFLKYLYSYTNTFLLSIQIIYLL